MLGDRFGAVEGEDLALSRFVQEEMRSGGGGQSKEGDDSGKQQEEMEEKNTMLNLLLLVKNFDDKLMNEFIKQISE